VSKYDKVMMEIVILEIDPLDTKRILAMRRIGGKMGIVPARYTTSIRARTAWRGGQGICKGDEQTLLPIRWNGCGHGDNISIFLLKAGGRNAHSCECYEKRGVRM
jgi:hypothetical protein